jgi:superfamily I DNA/RNA helicase
MNQSLVPSKEQEAIIGAPLGPISVVACAGSGKTFTAVRRLAEIRTRLGEKRGKVALLSFSNIAVDTFRENYRSLEKSNPRLASAGVEITTLDSFITTNIIRPHAHRTMEANQLAYLVNGTENFLKGFSIWHDNRPICISKLRSEFVDENWHFFHTPFEKKISLDSKEALKKLESLGKTGAYTYDLARYWALRTLVEQPAILTALARRYPHILIDEAQDVGNLHQIFLEILIEKGVQLSLIGDPNQGIFEFAGANGKFLETYGQRANVRSLVLSENYRSIPTILGAANNLFAQANTPKREREHERHGAYFLEYDPADKHAMVTSFIEEVASSGLAIEKSAILCRGTALVEELLDTQNDRGSGVMKGLVNAALLRDKHGDYLGSFRAAARSIVNLLENAPADLCSRIELSTSEPESLAIRRLIWNFVRNPDVGLPACKLIGDSTWHVAVLTRTTALLSQISTSHKFSLCANLGNKLSKKKLPKIALYDPALTAAVDYSRIRISTVHQAKGESLDAVLYVATTENLNKMLNGVGTEQGRIGYVAITRAKDLLVLGIPKTTSIAIRKYLLASGFDELVPETKVSLEVFFT